MVEEFDSGDEVFKHFETWCVGKRATRRGRRTENASLRSSPILACARKSPVCCAAADRSPTPSTSDFARTLTLDVQLLGASEHSKLTFENIEKDYEFEHTSDPTTVVGSLEDGRDTILVGAQGNLTIAQLERNCGRIRYRGP